MRVFIIQNTELESGLPLSVYLTSFIKNLKPGKNLELNLIVSRSKNISSEIIKKLNGLYQVNSSLYKVKDNIKFAFKVLGILQRENKRKPIDIIHCFYPNSSLLGAVLFKILSKSRAKIIYDVRSPWIEMIFARNHIKGMKSGLIKKLLNFKEKNLLRYVDFLVFITDGLKDYYCKKYNIGHKPFSIIPSGVDINLFKSGKSDYRKKLGYTDKDIVIGYIGTLCESRKLHEFIDLFKNSKQDNLKLLFVGSGSAKDDLKKCVDNTNLNNKIEFKEPVPHDEIPKYIRAFDYGLSHLPDKFVYRHSFPLKILEYLACGIPVLASDIAAHSDIKAFFPKQVMLYKTSFPKLVKKPVRKENKNIVIYSWNSLSRKYANIYRQYEKTNNKLS